VQRYVNLNEIILTEVGECKASSRTGWMWLADSFCEDDKGDSGLAMMLARNCRCELVKRGGVSGASLVEFNARRYLSAVRNRFTLTIGVPMVQCCRNVIGCRPWV